MILVGVIMGLSATRSNSDEILIPQNESIIYEIKKLGMTVGQAVITYHGSVNYQGKSAFFIEVTAEGFKFYDKESIYLDPVTFYPIAVDRIIDVLGKKEKISEVYHHQEGYIEIKKKSKNGNETVRIDKQGPIENIYGFIYRLRKIGRFDQGEKFKINLPTKEVLLSVKGDEMLKINKKEVNTYFLSSDPKEFGVWFGKNSPFVPLRIDGAVGFGNTAMIFKEYSKEK